MRAAYRQFDAGPVINLARHPRGTAYLGAVQAPKWENGRWGGDGVYSLITGVGGHPDGITTAARLTITTTPRNSHGFHLAGNVEGVANSEVDRSTPVQPGERIAITCWLRYTGPTVQAYTIRVRPLTTDGLAWLSGSVISQNFSLPSGAWVQCTYTYTVPVGAGYLSVMVTNGSGAVDAVGDTIDGTGLMVTRAPAPRANLADDPYATRSTIPNGAWGWTPRWFGGTGNTGTTASVAGASDGPDGISTYLRKTWTAVVTSVQDVAYTHTANGVRASQGDVLTISSYFRASKGWTVTSQCRLVIAWYDGGGVQIGANVFGPNIPTVTADAWHKLSITATAPANAVTMFAYQMVYVQNGAWAPGDTIDGTELMVTRTPLRWQFADGNSPGWRWLGAVNTSESAGYSKP